MKNTAAARIATIALAALNGNGREILWFFKRIPYGFAL